MPSSTMDGDREETLSFSDLQFFNDDLVDSKEFSAGENRNSSSSSSFSFNQDFLGFFSEGWSISSTATTSISSNTPEDIIFCGKVIDTSRNVQKQNPNNKTDPKNNNNSSLTRLNSDSFFKCSKRHCSSCTSRSNSFPVSGRKKDYNILKNDVSAQRMSSKLACPSKSRWQVFMFGSGRFPTKMELSDIRSRQLRRSLSKTFEEKGGGKRLTGLIRVLGCGGGFNNDE